MNSTGRLTRLIGALALTVPLTAPADDGRWNDDYRERWDARGQQVRLFDHRQVRHGDYRDRRWRGQWRHGGWRYPWTRGWRPGRHPYWYVGPRGHWRRWDQGRFLTGALIGSTVTRAALHDRGDHRHCDHRRAPGAVPVTCYRVERLPGGGERRVPLPDAACF